MARLCFVLILVLAGWASAVQPLGAAQKEDYESPQRQTTRIADSFWGRDKHQHFVGSLIHTVFWGKLLQEKAGLEKPPAMMVAGGITFSLGVGKEFRDAHRPGNHFCWKDLFADALGVVVGLVLLNQP